MRLTSAAPVREESAPTRTARSVLLRQANWALADQALSSGTNFALALIVVRSVTAREYGVFSILVIISIVAIGGTRALLSEPVLLRAHELTDVHITRDTRRESVSAALVVGVALGALCLVAGITVGNELRAPLTVLGCTFPLLLVQDVGRVLFFASRTPRNAALNDGLWAILQLGAIAAILNSDNHAVWRFALAWLGAGAVCGLVALLQLRVLPSFRLGVGHVGRTFTWNLPLFWNFALTSGPQYAVFAIAPLVSSFRELGLARAAFVPFGALGIILQSTSLVLFPTLAGLGLGPAKRVAARASGLLGSLTVAMGAIVLAIPEPLGVKLVGEDWSATRPAQLAFWALLLAQALGIGPTSALRSLGRANQLVKVRLISLGPVLALGIALSWWLGAPGTVAAIAVGEAMTTIGSTKALRRRVPVNPFDPSHQGPNDSGRAQPVVLSFALQQPKASRVRSARTEPERPGPRGSRHSTGAPGSVGAGATAPTGQRRREPRWKPVI